jgi:hypothetical protein
MNVYLWHKADISRTHLMSAFGGKADIAVNFALSRPVKTPDGFCFVVILPDGFAATASRRRGRSKKRLRVSVNDC